jgi:septum formation protein
MKIILASQSPRRIALLKKIGLRFDVQPSGVDESAVRGGTPREKAIEAARLKALDVAARLTGDALVIAADTVVCRGKKIYGKPANAAEARKTLRELSGRVHRVITGLALKHVEPSARISSLPELLLDAVETKVYFKRLSPRTIERYLRTAEPFDKAGAYGIQGDGARLVERLEGCYFNVVGLPLPRLLEILSRYIDVSHLRLPSNPLDLPSGKINRAAL